ncbi:MAG: hypothetical protein NC340_10665 [Ruminococcus flavefaciens]|nr:hypothetical protein [Ruminococcus flavefaciens]
MPKIMLTETQADKERMRSNLWAVKGILRVSNAGLARLIGVTGATVGNRLANPDSLTYGEIRRICKAAKIDMARFVSESLSIK